MVVQIHTGEFYYIGPGGSVLNTPAAHWVGWLNSLFRSCVPLFVMISGVFLFPVKDEGAFFRKRFSRVLVPFVVWCVIYAFYLYWQGTTSLQGALLDIDHGTYPFVTSSSSTAGGAVTGTGVGPTRIGTVIGVTKAYVTRVGEGPFPTEIHDSTSDLLRARGQEYGAVTGRPRRCGWLDMPLLRYSNMINGTEWLVVTKMDVLDECAEIPVCTGYKINGKLTDVIPADMPGYNAIEPVYTKLKGWNSSTEGITEFDKLPKLAQEYLSFVEKESGAKIGMVSTGPDRDQTMMLPEFDEALKA